MILRHIYSEEEICGSQPWLHLRRFKNTDAGTHAYRFWFCWFEIGCRHWCIWKVPQIYRTCGSENWKQESEGGSGLRAGHWKVQGSRGARRCQGVARIKTRWMLDSGVRAELTTGVWGWEEHSGCAEGSGLGSGDQDESGMSSLVISAVAHRTGSQKIGMGPLTRQKPNTNFVYTELRRVKKEKKRSLAWQWRLDETPWEN